MVGGAANPLTKGCSDVPFGTGGSTFSELDGFRRDEGVLLRAGVSFGPREDGRGGTLSSLTRSERDERESRSLPPSGRCL